MQNDLKDYAEYESVFNDDLVVTVRSILKKVEDNSGYDFVDSPEHNVLVSYFNLFGLHNKLSKELFESMRK